MRLRCLGSQPRAKWLCGEAVQEANARGLSIRGIARELGIHRNTARKYAAAERPPVMALRNVAVALPDTMNNNAD